MDVILIEKGIQLKGINLKVLGEINKQPPIEYISANILYEMTGNPDDEAAAVEAVMYCRKKYAVSVICLKK